MIKKHEDEKCALLEEWEKREKEKEVDLDKDIDELVQNKVRLYV